MSIHSSLTRSHGLWLGLGVVVIFLATSGALSIGSAPTPSAWVTPNTLQDAPDFRLDRLNGDTFRLREHRGKVVVLNFWATWCPPCREEIPDFVQLQRDLGERGVQFVGVALERNPNPDAVRDFAEEMNVNYPIGLDDGTIARKYGGIRTLPTTFVIGPNGKIRGHIPGRTTAARLRPALEQLLSESTEQAPDSP